MNKRIISLAALILALCISANAFAATPEFSPEAQYLWENFEETELSIGPGLLVLDKPQKGANTEEYVIPAVIYKKGSLYYEINKGGYKIFENSINEHESYSIDLIAKYRPEGYNSSDSFTLRGMSDRDPTVDGGISWVYDNDNLGDFEVSFLVDMLGKHSGKEIDAHYSIPIYIEKCRLAPGFGFKWLSSNLTNYYYGVRSKEALPGRPKYTPGETTNVYFDLSYLHVINENWTLFSHITFEWLNKKIRKSPIVNEDEAITLFVGLMYNF